MTSPVIPELLTDAETLDEVMENVRDALQAALELYEDLGRPIPANIEQRTDRNPIWFESLVVAT